jgi:hypothetical protein
MEEFVQGFYRAVEHHLEPLESALDRVRPGSRRTSTRSALWFPGSRASCWCILCLRLGRVAGGGRLVFRLEPLRRETPDGRGSGDTETLTDSSMAAFGQKRLYSRGAESGRSTALSDPCGFSSRLVRGPGVGVTYGDAARRVLRTLRTP